MSPTVLELQNGIRAATGRFEREVSASFTKEELVAICEALDVDVGDSGRPSTSQMRRRIRLAVEIADTLEDADEGSFRKPDLEAIARELDVLVDE